MPELLEVKNLSVSFFTPAGEVQAVRDVSFSLKAGEVLALVGESGCGKSALCRSIMKLLPGTARIKSGSILANGADITHYGERDMKKLRGRLFAMVLQDPMTALNPVMTVGAQIAEAVRLRYPEISRRELQGRVVELLQLVELDCPKVRAGQYPFQLSGGMAQRCVIAIALAANPAVLFADEPTTSLDVEVQAQILDLFLELREKLGMAVIFITHNPKVAARVADRVALMRAGELYRIGDAEEIFEEIIHNHH